MYIGLSPSVELLGARSGGTNLCVRSKPPVIRDKLGDGRVTILASQAIPYIHTLEHIARH